MPNLRGSVLNQFFTGLSGGLQKSLPSITDLLLRSAILQSDRNLDIFKFNSQKELEAAKALAEGNDDLANQILNQRIGSGNTSSPFDFNFSGIPNPDPSLTNLIPQSTIPNQGTQIPTPVIQPGQNFTPATPPLQSPKQTTPQFLDPLEQKLGFKISGLQLTPGRRQFLERRLPEIESFGNPRIKQTVAKLAAIIPDEQKFQEAISKFRPDQKEINTLAVLEEAKTTNDNLKKLNELDPEAGGPVAAFRLKVPPFLGGEDLEIAGVRAAFSNDPRVEITNELVRQRANIINALRGAATGGTAGANLTKNEQEALLALVPDPRSDAKTFRRQIIRFDKVLKQLFKKRLATNRAIGKDFGRFETLDIDQDLSDLSDEFLDEISGVKRKNSNIQQSPSKTQTQEKSSNLTPSTQTAPSIDSSVNSEFIKGPDGVFVRRNKIQPEQAPDGSFAALPAEARVTQTPKPSRIVLGLSRVLQSASPDKVRQMLRNATPVQKRLILEAIDFLDQQQ